MRARLACLYEAINSLGDAKLMNDKHEAKLKFIALKNEKIETDMKEL